MVGRGEQFRLALDVWASFGNESRMIQVSLNCSSCEEEKQLQEVPESQNLALFLTTRCTPRINSSDPSEESLGAALTKCRCCAAELRELETGNSTFHGAPALIHPRRLSSQNSWRRLAESSLTALQAINRIRLHLSILPDHKFRATTAHATRHSGKASFCFVSFQFQLDVDTAPLAALKHELVESSSDCGECGEYFRSLGAIWGRLSSSRPD